MTARAFLIMIAALAAGDATAGQAPPQTGTPICAKHPEVIHDVAQRTQSRALRARDPNARPEGRPVEAGVNPGGGDCEADVTLRGQAAAAVGALRYDGLPMCSAVLVTPTMILTAAHCIKYFDFHRMEFTLGVDSDRPVQRSGIDAANVHPDYDDHRLGVHDLAYAYLSKRMTEATPVELSHGPLPRLINILLLNVGYGIAGPKIGGRRCVDIPVHDFCDDTFSHAAKDLNTCHGDSGGGIFYDLTGRLELVGLTGWGDDACSQFSVNVDLGPYRDWVESKKLHAPELVPYARVEPPARKDSPVQPDAFFTDVSGPQGVDEFESRYRGSFVTWDARIANVLPKPANQRPGICDLWVLVGQTPQPHKIWLHEYPGGCDLRAGADVRFTGRLALLRSNSVDVVMVEPVVSGPIAQPPVRPVLGSYVITKLVLQVNEERQAQTSDLRLESAHGSWSGRVRECHEIKVPAPWRLDRQTPIVFKPAYLNHGGFEAPQNVSDQGFCIPLWAEGFGGAQAFGTTLDAGQVGVISGTVAYGLVRNEPKIQEEIVKTGTIPDDLAGVAIPVFADGQYVVTIKTPDGRQETLKNSGSFGGIAALWSGNAIQLRPKLDF